jgi:hypothetical protein
VQDDLDENEIRVIQGYHLLEPWRPSEDGQRVHFSTMDETVRLSLTTPPSRNRTQPIALGWPRRALQTTVLELPATWAAQQWDEHWDVGGLSAACSARLANGGRRLELTSMVEVRERVLPAELALRYFDVADKARRSAAVTLTHRIANGEFASLARPRPRQGAGRLLAPALLLAAAIALLVWGAMSGVHVPGLG